MPSSVPVIDLRPWFGGGEAVSAQFLKERYDAITIG
jgi:hypothetical protein